jgi:hypothetical protein
MNSAIHYYTAAQRNADAIRESRRLPLPPRPVRVPGDPTPRRGLKRRTRGALAFARAAIYDSRSAG